MVDLLPGANIALPGAAVTVGLDGPFDLSALVVDTSGSVSGDADMVFWNAPDAPGVVLGPSGITVAPSRLRSGAAKVVVVASPAQEGVPFGSLPPPTCVLTGGAGHRFARLVAPRLGPESVVLLAEIYRRDGRWRLRAVGQGYADGLAGLARDFGVDVAGHSIVDEVVTAANAERARHRLGLLTLDPQLARAAQQHSDRRRTRSRRLLRRVLDAGVRHAPVGRVVTGGRFPHCNRRALDTEGRHGADDGPALPARPVDNAGRHRHRALPNNRSADAGDTALFRGAGMATGLPGPRGGTVQHRHQLVVHDPGGCRVVQGADTTALQHDIAGVAAAALVDPLREPGAGTRS